MKVASHFRSIYPKVKIAVEKGNSSAAIRQFIIGYSSQRRGEKSRSGHDAASQTTVLASSREMTKKEISNFASRYGYEPLVIPIAMDGVAIYVHRDNPIQGLTLDQVDAIYNKKPAGSAIRTWGQLGVRGRENEPIHAYGRERDSGTHDFFEHVALNGGHMKDNVIMKPGSASEILAIANDPNGIGFAGIGYNSSYVRVVPLAGRAADRFTIPTAETVQEGAYPLGRFLYLYVNQAPNDEFDPELREFLHFVNSREGQTVIANSGVYPVPHSVLAKNLERLSGHTVTAAASR
jgi:phosphate transport system substrate-binding protein